MAVVGIETVPWDEGDFFGERGAEQRLRVSSFGHRNPKEQASLGMGPGDFRRKILVESMQHGIAALAVDLADELDVLIEEAVAGNFVRYVLIERGSVQVGRLLELHQFDDHVL